MGSCYSNLAAAHQFFIQQQQQQEQQEQQQEPQSLSFINENNNLIVVDKSPIVDYQQSPKIDSKIEKLSKHTIHSQNPSLKLINKTPKSCDPKVIGEIDEHQKCLDYSYKKKTNRRKKRSSSSSSCSTNRNNSLPSTPSKQQLSSPSKKHKKKRQLFRRIRETILNNKRTTNFTVKHQSRADDNHTQKSYVDDKKPIEETLINTYQVSFVPATSELFEIVCVSSDQSDEDESRENERNDRKQVALFARIKNRFSLRNIANLTKSGKGKKNNNNTNTNQRKEKDSHAPKENYLDEDDDYEREKHSNLRRNEDKMSYLKHPFRSNVQSMVNSNNNDNNGNNNGTTAAAAAFGGKIISSGFVRKKTEQFQTLYNEMDNLQKFSNMPTLEAKSTNNNNNNDNNCQQKSNKKNENNLDRAQPHQPSKLLPPTNVVTSTSNSIFRGLRSRIPSMIAKSTGNVNGALHQSSNQQQQPRFIKNANIRGTKTAATAAPTSSSTTTTTTATTNLIKPISAPTLSSSCCSSSSSSSSSTSSLNQPIRPPIFKAQNSSKSLKQQQKKLSTNLKPPTATVVPSQHAQTMVRKSSSSSNLLSTENPPVAPALPPKPSTAITQAKTVLSIEPKQAQIVSMATKTSTHQQQQQESRLNPTSGLAPPDMNRIGIPIMKPSFGGTIPPALSTQTSQRQQQRLNFLYGIQPTSPVHPIVPRIFGSQPQPQPLPQPVPAINKSSLMFNNNNNINHNSIAQHYQRDNNNKYPSKGEHSMMTSRIKTNHASSNHPETTSLAYMPYSRQQPAMKKSTLPTTNGNPMVPSMANRNKPSLLYNKPQQQYSANSRQNNNRNNLTFSKANYNNNNNNNANQSYRKNTEDLNGNFLSKPNPSMAHTTATTTGTLEEFFVAKNFSRNQYLSLVGKEISPIIGTDSSTMTKRRMVNNDDHDDGDHNSLTPQMIKQHQFNDALILSQSDSDHPKTDGTFSACSSMVEDEDEDGLSTCSVRTEDFLPNKQTQDRGNMNQISSMMSSGSTGSNPCSASICSTASTTSSFVFDPNRGSRNGHSHQPRPRFHTGSTSTSSCSNRDLFLIDDEIADQPALMISGNGNQSTIEEKRLQSILNLSDLVDEKNWIMSPTKTLTPSSTSNTVTTVSSNNDSPVTNHHQTSSSNTVTPSCELMLQSLNHELDNLILQTNIDYQSLPPNNGDNITDSNGTGEVPVPVSNSSQPIQNTTKAANTRIDRIGSSCKLRKRHSYTSSSSSSNSTSPGNAHHHHHHVPVVFRRPRPLSFVENDDGSFGLDTPSLRAVAQDLIGIKTLLFRLQNVLQNAETQNPFGPVVDRPSPRSSSYEWSDKVAIGSESNHDQPSLMQMLREEIFDLKQHNQLLEQQMIEKDRTIRLLQQQMAKYTTNGNIIEPSSARRQNTMVDYHGAVGDGCSSCSCSCSNHIINNNHNNNHNNNNNNADFGAKPSTIQLMNSTTQTEPRDYNYHPRMSTTVTNTAAAANLTAVGVQDSLNNNNVDNVSDSVKC